MVKQVYKFLMIACITGVLAGCASTTEDQTQGVETKIPATSKFSKIKIGMSQKQVYDLIGLPTDSKVYSTGKSWIPFYFGSDVVRRECLYKGEGKITFTGRNYFKVHRIIYDPTENGYN